MAVAFLTNDFIVHEGAMIPGGCSYYRCVLPQLAVSGARFGSPAWTPTDGFGVRVNDTNAMFGYNTVVLKLLMDAAIPSQIRQARALGQRVIVDVDDHYDNMPEWNSALVATDPGVSKALNRDHYRESILAADTVTVSTPFLRDYYREFHPDVRLVRNGVLPAQFVYRKPVNRNPVVGWVGAVPWKEGDLEILRAWLPEFLDEHDLLFHHSGEGLGHRSFAEVTGIPASRLTSSPAVPITDYHRLFAPIDIGIVPLVLNDFNEAKSNIKGLEYAASGIPFVAAPTGEYGRLAESGVGATALSPDDWWAQMSALLPYKARRRAAATALANLDKWTIQARAGEWAEVLGSGRG